MLIRFASSASRHRNAIVRNGSLITGIKKEEWPTIEITLVRRICSESVCYLYNRSNGTRIERIARINTDQIQLSISENQSFSVNIRVLFYVTDPMEYQALIDYCLLPNSAYRLVTSSAAATFFSFPLPQTAARSVSPFPGPCIPLLFDQTQRDVPVAIAWNHMYRVHWRSPPHRKTYP